MSEFYQRQVRKLIDRLISRSGRLLIEVLEAVRQFRFQTATSLLLEFLDEADALMARISAMIKRRSIDTVGHVIRELLQVIRSQVVFVDQYMQSRYTF
jgi:hypothetical protein